MTLKELSREYRESGDRLRHRLRLLRRSRREYRGADKEYLWRLDRRIGALTELLRQVNELEELTAHYYERGYWRNEKYTL